MSRFTTVQILIPNSLYFDLGKKDKSEEKLKLPNRFTDPDLRNYLFCPGQNITNLESKKFTVTDLNIIYT